MIQNNLDLSKTARIKVIYQNLFVNLDKRR
jgi:hypothetical protein